MKRIIQTVIVVAVLVVSTLYIQDLQEKELPVSAEQSLKGVVVCLDPGHGGLDNGASAGRVKEDEINLKICFALKEELETRGATVYMTREDDQDMTKRNHNYSKQDDMYLRVRQIDDFKPDYLLSIHLNASPSTRAWGSQVFYFNRSENGKVLATEIHEAMKEITGTKKKISGSDFHVLRATQTLGVLIECGFLSNGNERGQLQNSSYHKKLATTIVNGLENYHAKAPEKIEEPTEEILE